MQHDQQTKPSNVELLHEEQWRAESRVNWIRSAALIGLYGQHLASVYVMKDATITPEFHRTVSLICAAWFLAIVGIYYCLSRRWLPPYLKYGAALWDLAMSSVVISLGDGPRSSLLVLLPLVIGASAVRLSLGLVWFSALGGMVCYLLILGRYAWVQVGFDKYYSTPELRIPRTQELIMLIALGVAGLLAGQAVRQAQRLLKLQGSPA